MIYEGLIHHSMVVAVNSLDIYTQRSATQKQKGPSKSNQQSNWTESSQWAQPVMVKTHFIIRVMRGLHRVIHFQVNTWQNETDLIQLTSVDFCE